MYSRKHRENRNTQSFQKTTRLNHTKHRIQKEKNRRFSQKIKKSKRSE